MYDELATFYAERQRYQDLFILLVKSHRLEKAIDVCIEQRSSDSAGRIKEDDILKLIDYLCAGQMMKKSSIMTVRDLEKNGHKLPPKVASRVQQWNDARRTYYDNSSTVVYAVLKDSDLLPFFSLRVSYEHCIL